LPIAEDLFVCCYMLLFLFSFWLITIYLFVTILWPNYYGLLVGATAKKDLAGELFFRSQIAMLMSEIRPKQSSLFNEPTSSAARNGKPMCSSELTGLFDRLADGPRPGRRRDAVLG